MIDEKDTSTKWTDLGFNPVVPVPLPAPSDKG